MKTALVAIYGIFVLAYLPISIYGSCLLYKHIHATELMWFTWWMLVPLAVLFQVFSSITKKMSED